MRYAREFNGKTVSFLCDDALAPTAKLFADILEQEDAAHGILEDRKALRIGWGFYQVSCRDGECRILARDLAGDPFRDTTEDLSLSLRIFAAQNQAVRAAGASLDTSFQDTMILEKDAVRAERVFLRRDPPRGQGDSGWYLGVVGRRSPVRPEDCVRAYTYQLLGACPGALPVLLLPEGSLCLFEKGRLVEAVDQDNEPIL